MENKLSIRLKTLRKQLALTTDQVINKLSKLNKKYSVQSLYKWEDGSVVPSLNILKELSIIYKCNMSYLVEGSNYEYKKLSACENHLLNIYRTDFLFRSIIIQIIKKMERDK